MKLVTTLLACASFAASAAADTIIVPTVPTTSSNASPFGTGVAGGRYQQVYTSAAFSDPISVNSLAFEPFSVSSPVIYNANVEIRLGTTAAPVNGLSTDLDANAATGLTSVFVDPNFSTTLVAGYSLIFDFSASPFLYDPTDGNLLLDVVISDKSSNTGNFGFSLVAFNTESSRAFSSGGVTTAGIGALKTQFGFSPVPEPTTLCLLFQFLTVAILIVRSRRRCR